MIIPNLMPGQIVVTQFTTYQHWAIVSDRTSLYNIPMLISASKRNNTVQEEEWDTVTKGNKTYIADINIQLPTIEILKNARSQIGIWQYSILDNNCEHFAKWSVGLGNSSMQVQVGATIAAIGAVTLILKDKPETVKIIIATAAIAGIAMWALQPAKK